MGVGSSSQHSGSVQLAEAVIAGVHFVFDGHMRVSVPHIPQAILNATPAQCQVITAAEAISKLCDFVDSGSLTVLTGAGVSVDSGIRAYRGPDGRYMNPNYK